MLDTANNVSFDLPISVSHSFEITELPLPFWPFWLAQEKKVFNYCYFRLTHHYHDAQDLCSETMLKAYDNLPKVKSIENLKGWLFRIARHVYFDQIRRNNCHLRFCLTLEDEDFIPDQLFNTALNDRVIIFIKRSILKLPEQHKNIVFDYFFHDKSYQQISMEQGETESQIRKVIFRFRKKVHPQIFRFLNK